MRKSIPCALHGLAALVPLGYVNVVNVGGKLVKPAFTCHTCAVTVRISSGELEDVMAGGEPALVALLGRAGMNPRQLAIEINRRLECRGQRGRRIDLTAPYSWARKGYKPYEPIPAVAAAVLSERLGSPVTVDDLWPEHRAACAESLTTVSGVGTYSTVDDALAAIGELVAFSAGTHTEITPATGPDLAAAVHHGLSVALTSSPPGSASRERILQPQVDVIAAHVAALRKLDDRHGGGALSVRYSTGQLRAILDLVRSADYEPAVGHQLLTIVADLAQLVGWVHFDAGRQGAAERYLLLSCWIAKAMGEPGRTANAIGMLSYVSAFSGHGADAVHISIAAERACPSIKVLRARIMGRKATACAAAGDLSGFRAASDTARALLDEHRGGQAPSYLYYLEPEQLVVETGHALIVLADRTTVGRRLLLKEAITLLTPLSEAGARPEYPRSALLHGTFLARAHLMYGDLDAAVHAARATLTRLQEVQSIRGLVHLRRLRREFARRKRSEVISTFLPEFDAAIPDHDR